MKKGGSWCLSLFFVLMIPGLAGCALTGLPFGYPHFWDYTTVKPNEADLVGTYKFLKSSGSIGCCHDYQDNRNITFTLYADHTANITAMPEIDSDELKDGFKVGCVYSGPGVWALDDYGDPNNDEWHILIETKQSAKTTTNKTWGPCSVWGMLILSRHPPYRFYEMLGDPDNDTGLEFARVKP